MSFEIINLKYLFSMQDPLITLPPIRECPKFKVD